MSFLAKVRRVLPGLLSTTSPLQMLVGLGDHLFSIRRICQVCGAEFYDDLPCYICHDCVSRFPVASAGRCTRCGKPGIGPDDGVCSDCSTRQTWFQVSVELGVYTGYLRELIHSLKYQGAVGIGYGLGLLLGETLISREEWKGVALILPVPLHDERRAERGFNQAEALADGVSLVTGVPVISDNLIRTRASEDQKSMAGSRRRDNVRGVFVVSRPSEVSGISVAVVDDVMTTGSTINECAYELRKAGAARVVAAVAASGVWSEGQAP